MIVTFPATRVMDALPALVEQVPVRPVRAA